MDSLEKELWEMCDVRGLGSHLFSSFLGLGDISTKVDKNKKNIMKDWEEIKTQYDSHVGKINKIDLESLDENFSLSIHKEIKEEIIPKLNQEYEELDLLLIDYVAGSNVNSEKITEKIETCQGIVNRMLYLSQEFKNNKRYMEYRLFKVRERITNETIDQLYKNHEEQIRTDKSLYKVQLEIDENVFDTQIWDGKTLVGYCTISKDKRGFYNLVGYPLGIDHPGLDGGWAVEVHKDFEDRNIGHALLSFGIGIVQRDFKENGGMDVFEVRVAGLGDRVEFYKQFGFETIHHETGAKKPQIIGRYRKMTVQPINIID